MTLPSRKEVWLLAVVIMLHLANGALVVVNDRLPVVSDSLDYYRWSFQVAERLKEGDITGGGMELFGQALRPPVGILAAVAAQLIAGERSSTAGKLSSLFWLALLMVVTYLLGCRLFDPGAGVLAAAALAATPLVMGFSRLLWMDVPLATMVAVTLLYLLSSEGLTRPRAALLFGFCCLLGSLTRHTFAMFVAPVALVEMIRGVRMARSRLVPLGLGTVAVIGAALPFTFYWLFFNEAMRGYLVDSQTAYVETSTYTFFSIERIWQYIVALPDASLGPVIFSLALLGLAGLAYRRSWRALGFLAVWSLVPLILLGFFFPWHRYYLPAIPPLALAIGGGLTQLTGRRVSRFMIPAVVVLLCLLSIQQSWFGPLLTERNVPQYGLWTRISMAGLIRPEYAPRQRLRFARISTREKPSVLNLVASPSRFLPEAPPSPFDQVPNAINEWLITDLEIYGFTRAWKREADPKAALKDKAYVILATPGQMLMVPPEELVAYYQLKKLIEGAPKDWLAVGRERYPGGSVLTLYKSRAYWERWER